MCRQTKKLWQYWYEHSALEACIWQTIESNKSTIKIRMIFFSSLRPRGRSTILGLLFKVGDCLLLNPDHLLDEEIWTPIKKTDIPLIVLKHTP